MVLSLFYEDSDVVNQLRAFFSVDEQWEIDFWSLLALVTDYDEENDMLKIKDKTFLIHKIHGTVTEVE